MGGVWSAERLYPALKSNNLLGTYEYSDFPMTTASYGVKPGEHIPGSVLHAYLTDYAANFGVLDRIRFQSRVEAVQRSEGKEWRLTVSSQDQESQVETEKLIVATGLTSEPFIPAFEGSEDCNISIFHSKDFHQHASSVKTTSRAVVLGGHKSAWDAAYVYATAGAEVHLVMRESGHGPIWMAPPYVTPLKKWLEKLVHTRFLTWLSPCIWGAADGFASVRNFLHASIVGRFIVDSFWSILANDVLSLNGYDNHPETKKLKPWSNPFFIASSLSILNYETDFFDLVRRGKIKVHVADIKSLSGDKVCLSNGEHISTDVLLCATGWRHHPPIKFLPEGNDEELGLPYYSDESDKEVIKADSEILSRFPRLKDQPAPNPKAKVQLAAPSNSPAAVKPNQPYRLYRFMVPPSTIHDRNIGFAGALMTISTALIAQTQALWLSAYFDGKIQLDEDVNYEAILHSQYGKWRYPAGRGAHFPDFVFDAIPYLDLLLSQLGLRSHRKKGKLAEVFEPYGPQDYPGLNDEWRMRHAKS